MTMSEVHKTAVDLLKDPSDLNAFSEVFRRIDVAEPLVVSVRQSEDGASFEAKTLDGSIWDLKVYAGDSVLVTDKGGVQVLLENDGNIIGPSHNLIERLGWEPHAAMENNDVSAAVWEGKWHTVLQNNWGQVESQGIVAKVGDGFAPGYQNSVNMDEPTVRMFPPVRDFAVAKELAESLSHSQDAIDAFHNLQQQTRSSLASTIPTGFEQTAIEARADSIALLSLANERGVDAAHQVLNYLKAQTEHAVDPADKRSMSNLNEIEGVLKAKPEYFSTPEAAHTHGMEIGTRGTIANNSQSIAPEKENAYLKGRSASVESAGAISHAMTAGPTEVSHSTPKLARGPSM